MVDATEGILGIEWIDGKSVRFLLGGGAEDEEEIIEDGDIPEDDADEVDTENVEDADVEEANVDDVDGEEAEATDDADVEATDDASNDDGVAGIPTATDGADTSSNTLTADINDPQG